MELENLKKGLFGYQKTGVYEYIASIEDEFSSKLLEKDQQLKKNEEIYMEKINKLEDELREAKKRIIEQDKGQEMISNTLLEANRFAQMLKKEAQEKHEEENRILLDMVEKQKKEIMKYQTKIDELKNMLHTLLEGMEKDVSVVEKRVEEVKMQCPSQNMSLFERRND